MHCLAIWGCKKDRFCIWKLHLSNCPLNYGCLVSLFNNIQNPRRVWNSERKMAYTLKFYYLPPIYSIDGFDQRSIFCSHSLVLNAGCSTSNTPKLNGSIHLNLVWPLKFSSDPKWTQGLEYQMFCSLWVQKCLSNFEFSTVKLHFT